MSSALVFCRVFATLVLLALAAGCGSSSGTDNPSPTFTLGGNVSGLAADQSAILQNNGSADLTVSTNGAFTFAQTIVGNYGVTVSRQPSGQICSVSQGTGIASAAVNNVQVTCVNLPANSFTVGGQISGLAAGASLVLQNSSTANLTISANGGFTFSPVAAGSSYAVTVLTQPVGQTCTVNNGTGTVAANVSNVTVACVNNTTPGNPNNAPASACLSRYAAITVNMTEAQVLAILGPATSRTPAVGNVLGLSWEAVSYQSGEVCDVLVGMDRNGAYSKGADVRDDGIDGVSELMRGFVPY
jgi:hypothetical protein